MSKMTMSMGKLIDFTKKALAPMKDGRRGMQFMVAGPPGSGKSQALGAAIKESGYNLMWWHGPNMDPTDTRGLPWAERRGDHTVAAFLPFDNLEAILQAKDPTTVIIDDVGHAPKMVQSSLGQVVHDRRIDGKPIPDCVCFLATTNDTDHNCGVAGWTEMFITRWNSIIHVEPDTDSFLAWWFAQRDLPVEPAVYVKQNPASLSVQPKDRSLRNWPNPRTWESVGRWEQIGVHDLQVIAGAIGEGEATKYCAWHEVASLIPSREEILMDPERARIPEDDSKAGPAAKWVVACQIPRWVEKGNYAKFQTYLDRMPQELMVFALQDIIRHAPQIACTPTFIKTVSRKDLASFFKGEYK